MGDGGEVASAGSLQEGDLLEALRGAGGGSLVDSGKTGIAEEGGFSGQWGLAG